MSLWRHDSTGFLCEFASPPGAGYTAVAAMPGDAAGRVTWWRQRCVDSALGQSSAWHPSLPSSTEIPLPRGLAGRGVNILHARYSAFDEASLPPVFGINCSASQVSGGIVGTNKVLINQTATGGNVRFSTALTDYNFPVTAYRRWIVSVYVQPSTNVAKAVRVFVKTNAAGAVYWLDGTTGASSSGWTRLTFALDLSADGSNRALIGVSPTTLGTAGAFYVDGLMMEELIGDTVVASAYSRPGTSPRLPDDYVDGRVVVSGSIHSVHTMDLSAQTIPWTSIGEPDGATYHETPPISFSANNYRTGILFFVQYYGLNIRPTGSNDCGRIGVIAACNGSDMAGIYYGMYARASGRTDSPSHGGINYFANYTFTRFHNPGVGAVYYNWKSGQNYEYAGSGDSGVYISISAFELSR